MNVEKTAEREEGYRTKATEMTDRKQTSELKTKKGKTESNSEDRQTALEIKR